MVLSTLKAIDIFHDGNWCAKWSSCCVSPNCLLFKLHIYIRCVNLNKLFTHSFPPVRCATDNGQQVPASFSYQPVRARVAAVRPFLQFVHVSSATSINVNFERPVACGACTKVCLIFPHYLPKANQGTHSKVNPFPGILYFTLSFNSVHPGIIWDKSDFSAFTVMIFINSSICFVMSVHLSRTLEMFNELMFWDLC